jgi:subtilisin family serine protease
MPTSLRSLLLAFILWMAAAASAWAEAAAPRMSDPAPESQQVLVLLRMAPDHLRADPNYAGGYGPGADRAARRRTANRLAHEHGLTLATGWPMPLVGVDCFVMDVPAGQSPDEVAARLSRERDVAWAEPMRLYRAQGKVSAPNDPLFKAQPAARAWRLADLHELSTGRNVRVAVVDSQIDEDHPDLAGQEMIRENFAPGHPSAAEQHGTAVAGIIAAVANNGLGIAGIAPGARLMALRACWQQVSDTVCDTLSLAKALHFAIEHDAQVINLSLSGPPDILLGRLLDVALARGAVVVGAVDPNLALGGFPASHPGVVAVASDPGEARAPRGSSAYLAPGRDIPTTLPGGRWSLVNGSSFAAAHVSGLFALLDARGGRGSHRPTLVTARSGGAIDACASLLQALGPCRGCACAQPGQ